MATVTQTAPQIKTAVPDIRVSNHGSVFLFSPTSAEAYESLQELVPPGPECHYFAHSLVVEHRFARAVADQLREDGLTVT